MLHIHVAFGDSAEFVARRQKQDEWSRLVERRIGLPFQLMKRMQAYDDPEVSLPGPIELNKLNAVGHQVAVAVDFDDTLVSSGGWLLRGLGTYLGGVDSSYPRGTPYPGMGALMYMLSMGSRRRIGRKLRPLSARVLPVVLCSARPSLRIGFRPRRLYRYIAAMYAHEASLLGAETQLKHKVTYENRIPLLTAITGTVPGLHVVPSLETVTDVIVILASLQCVTAAVDPLPSLQGKKEEGSLNSQAS